ncbi:DNA-directed DNA polymerase gamma mip1 [Tieghemiomyces parasiticus]|uniref:DNA-directed DNA polymerase n=1 Tax=Tieghemiomyces parasiticus TaxID=78921 RepID=A0A9W8AIQ0_9FUNG|nr:DNA-directed DNA polymerase gamma mip1 [Tieghemiomyces parasiticus]
MLHFPTPRSTTLLSDRLWRHRRRWLQITFRSRSTTASAPLRINPLGIELLPDHLQRAVFPYRRHAAAVPEQIALAQRHLQRQGIAYDTPEPLAKVDFQLPALQGATIQEHFERIGLNVAEPYLGYAQQAADFDLPPMPTTWVSDRSGWVRYAVGARPEPVERPREAILVFDVEVMFRCSPYAVLAAAASAEAWYLWVSPHLLEQSDRVEHLIPLGDDQPRLIIGHNVGFDRVRVADDYRLAAPTNVYVDTMSLHTATRGLCNQQRVDWFYYHKLEAAGPRGRTMADRTQMQRLAPLARAGSPNSLKEVAKLHCGIVVDKAPRDLFFGQSYDAIRKNFQELATYCARDVEVTHRVYRKLFPAFRRRCPHPVSFLGMTEMQSAALPVTEAWEEFIARAEACLAAISERIEARLLQLTEEALVHVDQDPADDPWLRHLDWTVAPVRMTQGKKGKDGQYLPSHEPRLHSRQRLPGKPAWYKSLWHGPTGRIRVTSKCRIAPYLLRLKWRGYPLYFSDRYGWTFRVPKEDALEMDDEALEFSTDPADPHYESYPAADRACGAFFRIPHTDGETARCLNPLAKGYVGAFENGLLTSEYEIAREALQLSAQCSYWISCRERVKSQLVIWDRDGDDGDSPRPANAPILGAADRGPDTKTGIILPQVVPMGTVTRRAVEATWMTASNAKPNRIGSELKAMVRAPPGYSLVGADVDSEELWISSLMGDAQFGLHGGTALGWMTLQGTKSAGTDMHSNTARIMGISRNHAKIFNYGRIYGAGVRFATQLLLKFNPATSAAEADRTARKLYEATKGHQFPAPAACTLPPATTEPAVSAAPASMGKPDITQPQEGKRADTAHRPTVYHPAKLWCGGSESYMFNSLEAVALTALPRTPTLGCAITETLTPQVSQSRYMTSRINWVVQSSGVDYLHLLIVAMKYLCTRYAIDARLLLTIHDEIRYLVKEEDRYRAGLALQVANLWTRALFSYRLGMEDLPLSVAFFSSVDVDSVMRKEVDLPCITPSHPTEIPPGESLTVQDLIKLTDGRLGSKEVRESATKATMAPNDEGVAGEDSARLSTDLRDFIHLRAQMATTPSELGNLYAGVAQTASHSKAAGEPGKTPNFRRKLSSIRVLRPSPRTK